MNARPNAADLAAADAAPGLVLNQVWYQVLAPSAVLGPGGVPHYEMWGPFADLATASRACSQKPGAFLTVTTVLFQAPAAVAPMSAVPPMRPK